MTSRLTETVLTNWNHWYAFPASEKAGIWAACPPRIWDFWRLTCYLSLFCFWVVSCDCHYLLSSLGVCGSDNTSLLYKSSRRAMPNELNPSSMLDITQIVGFWILCWFRNRRDCTLHVGTCEGRGFLWLWWSVLASWSIPGRGLLRKYEYHFFSNAGLQNCIWYVLVNHTSKLHGVTNRCFYQSHIISCTWNTMQKTVKSVYSLHHSS